MLKSYLLKRLLLVSAVAVCLALATPTILRRWMIEHLSAALNTPVTMGTVKIYPRSTTLHATNITLGDERSSAWFRIPQSWLIWKSDSWSDGPLRFRRAILDNVQIEADLASHDYFGVFAQLQTQSPGQLIPSVYRNDFSDSSSYETQKHIRATQATLQRYRTLWNQAKKNLQEAAALMQTVAAQIEKSDPLRPNSLRDKQDLENVMQQAITTGQQYLQAKHQVLSMAESFSQIEIELEKKQQDDLQRIRSEMHLDEMIIHDLSERMLKEYALAQTSVWLDYIATGRNLLGSLQLPRLTSNHGTIFHFANTAPEPQSLIDDLTMKGSLSIHHRNHDFFLRGWNLRSLPVPRTLTEVDVKGRKDTGLKPTVLRGEIKSRGEVLLFDFRRLWESQLQASSLKPNLPQWTASYSDVITLESPAVGPAVGEMKLAPTVSLAWQGNQSSIWTQWRFDAEDKWRAKWVIRQEDLHFTPQDRSLDQSATAVVESISDHTGELNRIDMEMDITCIQDQYAVTVTSNLDTWLPQMVKRVYRAEEQSQLEKVRTAIQQLRENELSLWREDLERERTRWAQEAEPVLARLEKLSIDLASKLGVSPRVMLSQEANGELKR